MLRRLLRRREARKRQKLREEVGAVHSEFLTLYYEPLGGIPKWMRDEWEAERAALFGDAITVEYTRYETACETTPRMLH